MSNLYDSQSMISFNEMIWGLLHKAGFRFYPVKFVFSLSKLSFWAQEGGLVLSGLRHHGNLRYTATLLQSRFYSGLEIANPD